MRSGKNKDGGAPSEAMEKILWKETEKLLQRLMKKWVLEDEDAPGGNEKTLSRN